MASLDSGNGLVDVTFSEVRGQRKRVGIWLLTLKSASDTFTVPSLTTTTSARALTSGHTASGSANSSGASTVTVTGGADGEVCVVATLHQAGRHNNLSIDETP
jgi:hypothetical protein